jgi:hypothetical protein
MECINFGDFTLFQDHSILGGTKYRAIAKYVSRLGNSVSELVYAGPANGCAHLALARAAKEGGLLSTSFLMWRSLDPKTLPSIVAESRKLGANLIVLKCTLVQLQAAAAAYAKKRSSRHLCPFGFNDQQFILDLAESIKSSISELVRSTVHRLWVTCGSGTLLRALLLVFPNAKIHAVQVGRSFWLDTLSDVDQDRVVLYRAAERFFDDCTIKPPYEALTNYDAKLWAVFQQHKEKDDFIWNVY